MSELDRLIKRGETLLERLETLLPPASRPVDWQASIAFRWRKTSRHGFYPAGDEPAPHPTFGPSRRRQPEGADRAEHAPVRRRPHGQQRALDRRPWNGEILPGQGRAQQVPSPGPAPDRSGKARSRRPLPISSTKLRGGPSGSFFFATIFHSSSRRRRATRRSRSCSTARLPATSRISSSMPPPTGGISCPSTCRKIWRPSTSARKSIPVKRWRRKSRFRSASGCGSPSTRSTKDDYLEIVSHWLRELGCREAEIPKARAEALQWAAAARIAQRPRGVAVCARLRRAQCRRRQGEALASCRARVDFAEDGCASSTAPSERISHRHGTIHLPTGSARC